MIGDGVLRTEAERVAKMVGLTNRVHFLGWCDNVVEWMNRFDVFLLTSLWEGLPRVLVECMLMGIPPVTTAVDGNAEIIRHEQNGYLADPHDTGALAGYVVKLLKEPELAAGISENARKTITDDFKIDNMVREQEDLYFSLAGRHG